MLTSEELNLAACAQVLSEGGEDVWFPPEYMNGNQVRQWEEAAITVCNKCPIQARCLTEALRMNPRPRGGVWGGMSFRRRPMRPVGSQLACFNESCNAVFTQVMISQIYCSNKCRWVQQKRRVRIWQPSS